MCSTPGIAGHPQHSSLFGGLDWTKSTLTGQVFATLLSYRWAQLPKTERPCCLSDLFGLQNRPEPLACRLTASSFSVSQHKSLVVPSLPMMVCSTCCRTCPAACTYTWVGKMPPRASPNLLKLCSTCATTLRAAMPFCPEVTFLKPWAAPSSPTTS